MQLIAENLVVDRGGRRILDGLTFTAEPGSATLLTGPNGSGKTTLLRALAGFLPLTDGAVRIEPGNAERTLAEQLHAIGHANAVKAHLSVYENVLFWARYLATDRGARARALDALDAFDLADIADFPASYLSAGQKRRAGLARLLAAPRRVWLLDEPSVSLDAASTARLAAVVNAHTAAGGIVVAATHLPLGLARTTELHLKSAGSAA